MTGSSTKLIIIALIAVFIIGFLGGGYRHVSGVTQNINLSTPTMNKSQKVFNATVSYKVVLTGYKIDGSTGQRLKSFSMTLPIGKQYINTLLSTINKEYTEITGIKVVVSLKVRNIENVNDYQVVLSNGMVLSKDNPTVTKSYKPSQSLTIKIQIQKVVLDGESKTLNMYPVSFQVNLTPYSVNGRSMYILERI